MIIEKEINPENNSEDDSAVDLDLKASEFDITGKLSIFLQKVESDCKWSVQTGDRPNPYWCPNFASNLLRISKHFILWTCILAPNGTTATSSRSEQYFRELKDLILKGDRNLRVDKFLIRHIRSISGTEKLLNATSESTTESTKSRVTIDVISKIDNVSKEILKCNEIEKLNDNTSHFEELMELNTVLKSHKIEKSNEFSILDDMTTPEEAETITKSFEETFLFT